MHRVGLGGAPVPPALAERAAAHGIAIIRAYGSTEHPSVTGGTFDEPAEKRHGTDGRADARRRDPPPRRRRHAGRARAARARSGHAVPTCASATPIPTLTDDAFDDDGWYRTGDMGVLDADGFLTITDRLKDVIIRGGENISAAEIEEAIATLPQIAEVAVVAAPDDRLGEHACAVVRLAPGATSIELRDITDELERIGLARQKWPEELRVVDDFPRTASGKIRKVDLRRELRGRSCAASPAEGQLVGVRSGAGAVSLRWMAR